jgi:hypothetical protein
LPVLGIRIQLPLNGEVPEQPGERAVETADMLWVAQVHVRADLFGTILT